MPLSEMIKSGEFFVLAEFETPKGADFTPLLKHANQIKGRIDAMVIPEMANAVMKASSLGGCAYFQNQGTGIVWRFRPISWLRRPWGSGISWPCPGRISGTATIPMHGRSMT